jgi:hypothetical protein
MELTTPEAAAAEVIDLDDPPTEPPRDCADSVLWRLARAEFDKHRRSMAAECVTCPAWRACSGNSLARDGLATAMGHESKNSAYWRAYVELSGVRP